MTLYIGLMSGTSMDGIDAAVVDIKTNQLIDGLTIAYSQPAKLFLDEVLRAKGVSLGLLGQLNRILGIEFANAVNQLLKQSNLKSSDIVAIGSHGQTLCHDAADDIPYTLQLGCGHTIAELTQIPVVADFRTRDIVLGGQGAPFAPLYHEALFSQLNCPLAVVNIGGIANLSVITPGKATEGFDTGPGNCLMDAWIYAKLGKAYDAGGSWAASGQVIERLLESLQEDVYFKKAAPKSIGKEYFSLAWLNYHINTLSDKRLNPEDIQATLLLLTALSVSTAILALPSSPKRVLICGGGVHNLFLLSKIRQMLPGLIVTSTQTQGVDPDYLEAMMFAWLADKAMNKISLNTPSITGARGPGLLGVIYPI